MREINEITESTTYIHDEFACDLLKTSSGQFKADDTSLATKTKLLLTPAPQ